MTTAGILEAIALNLLVYKYFRDIIAHTQLDWYLVLKANPVQGKGLPGPYALLDSSQTHKRARPVCCMLY